MSVSAAPSPIKQLDDPTLVRALNVAIPARTKEDTHDLDELSELFDDAMEAESSEEQTSVKKALEFGIKQGNKQIENAAANIENSIGIDIDNDIDTGKKKCRAQRNCL